MKRVLVAVSFNDECIKTLKSNLKDKQWDGVDEIHFVHGFYEQTYNSDFNILPHPSSIEYTDIKGSIIDSLEKLEDDILPKEHKIRIVTECLVSHHVKEAISNYAEKNKISQMYIATRNREGWKRFFSSSFAEYMVRHSNCELVILRPK